MEIHGLLLARSGNSGFYGDSSAQSGTGKLALSSSWNQPKLGWDKYQKSRIITSNHRFLCNFSRFEVMGRGFWYLSQPNIGWFHVILQRHFLAFNWSIIFQKFPRIPWAIDKNYEDSACRVRNPSTSKQEVFTCILLISVCKFECIGELFPICKENEINSPIHSNLHTEMSKTQGNLHV